MSDSSNVIGGVSIAFVALAAVCAFPGFLLNRPTTARRLMWRVACFLSMFLSSVADMALTHGWKWWLFVFIAAMWGSYAITAWRRAELLREIARQARKGLHLEVDR